MGVCGSECGGTMFIVASFPVTLQVAPDQNHRPNASAVNVNNFSISKKAISIRPNKTAARRNKRVGRRGGREGGRKRGREEREEAAAKRWRSGAGWRGGAAQETERERGREGGSDVVVLKEEKRRSSVSKKEIDGRANVVVCLLFVSLLCSQAGSTLRDTNSPKGL